MSLDDTRVHFVDCAETAAEMMRWLSTCERVALDTETTGLHHTASVRIAQLADAHQAWVIPVEMPGSWGGLLLEALEKFNGEVIMHNAKFDTRVLYNTLGRRIPLDAGKVHDTMMQARVLEPTKSAALKRLSTRHVDSRAAIMQSALDEAMEGGKHTWATVPLTFEPYWFYGGIDGILTYRLYDVQRAMLGDNNPAYELERHVLHSCLKMEFHGALINREFTVEAHDALAQYVREVAKWCRETYGCDPGKNLDVITRLEADGFEFDKLTKLGAKALDKDVLEGMLHHGLAAAVLSRRQSQKVVSTYLRHFVEDVDEHGRLHPLIETCKARTSRMSMAEPNLQNLPRKSGENHAADLVRYCIKPAEGHTLVMCDFDQVEFRVFSSLAPGNELATAFQTDDVFTEMSRQLYGDGAVRKTDPRRQTTKNCVYTRLYGGGDEKFALTAGLPLDDAKRFTGLLNMRYPEMRLLGKQIIDEARHNHQSHGEAYVTSPLTGRRFVIDDTSYYKLVNYKIQGTAAEVLKMKILELDAAGIGDLIVCPVHDEVIAEVPNEDVPEVAHIMHSVMNDANLFRVPLTASVSTGTSWGAKEDYPI